MPAHKWTRCFIAFVVMLSATMIVAQSTPSRPELDVPYVPTTPEAVTAMLRLADVKATDVVFDLGCGDGRIVIEAAKTFGARAVGIDIDPVRISEARENARKAGVENLVRFEEKDLFQADIHEASVVTLFLLSSVNLRLRPKLLQDLKPGTRIVSNPSRWATGRRTKRPRWATIPRHDTLAKICTCGPFHHGAETSRQIVS